MYSGKPTTRAELTSVDLADVVDERWSNCEVLIYFAGFVDLNYFTYDCSGKSCRHQKPSTAPVYLSALEHSLSLAIGDELYCGPNAELARIKGRNRDLLDHHLRSRPELSPPISYPIRQLQPVGIPESRQRVPPTNLSHVNQASPSD